jgi:heme exporter protein D
MEDQNLWRIFWLAFAITALPFAQLLKDAIVARWKQLRGKDFWTEQPKPIKQDRIPGEATYKAAFWIGSRLRR